MPITLVTSPPRLTVVVNGFSLRGGDTVTSWVGYRLDLEAPSPQGTNTFLSWTDGGARLHSVFTPAAGAVYTARFRRGGRVVRGILSPTKLSKRQRPPSERGQRLCCHPHRRDGVTAGVPDRAVRALMAHEVGERAAGER